MTHDRDVERLLDQWFADGPSEAPDRVLAVVGQRIHRRRQRPGWLVTRRTPAMSAPVRLLVMAALLVGALTVGYALILSGAGRSDSAVSSPPPATAVAVVEAPPATSEPTPDPSPRVFRSNTTMAAGPYVAQLDRGSMALQLPDGWGSPGQTPTDFSLRPLAGPPADMVNVWTDMRRASKDEACTEAPEPGVGMTSAELLADFQADDQLSVSDPVPVSLPGMTGVRVDVRLADGATRTCPFSSGAVSVPLVVDDLAGEGPFWGVGPGEVERLYLLDTAGGHNVVILLDSAAGDSFDALAAAADPVIASMAWTPDESATFQCADGTSTSCVGPLDAGTVHSGRFEPGFSITVPEGWQNAFDISRTYSMAPSPHTYDVQLLSHLAIPEQTTDCTPAAKKGAGNTVADWVEFLTTNPAFEVAKNDPVTVNGYQGQRIQFRIASGWTGRCPNSIGPAAVVFTDSGTPPQRAVWFDDHRVTAWILDVGGETIIVHVDSGPSYTANDADVKAFQPILDTLTFSSGS